ncbi:MAG: TlpA family protein disulfide reductase [Chloroflexi bacterium]|nr:TlpA family protein disulfide reductase [Chloroflexota bacterium]
MRTVFPAGIATIALVVTACGGGDAAPTAAPTATPASQATPTSTATATPSDKPFELPIPDFPISVYQGEEIVGGSEIVFSSLFAQGKPVVLNFWAGLCPPCRAEMPDLQEVYDEYKDKVLLFGADVGVFNALGSQEDGRALLRELNVSYPAGAATTNVVRSYRVFSMPTTLFITPSGEIDSRWNGLLNREKMGELIEELLEASA